MLAALLVAPASVGWAGPATETLRGFFDEASRIVTAPETGPGLEARRAAIRALADRVFDFRAAAAVALGPVWDLRTPAEQDEFARLFADLAERGYLTLVGSKARVSGGVRVLFLGEATDGDVATVRTSLVTRSGEELPVEYRMRPAGGRWAVHDVVVEGVSLVENYRAQFHRALQGSSYADVVALLRVRVPDASAAAAATAAPASEPPPSRAVARGVLVAAVELADAVIPVVDAPPVRPALVRVTVAPPPPPLPRRAAEQPGVAVGTLRSTRPAPPPTWWVQVGAFRSAEATSRLLERLERERAVAVFDTAAPSPIARVLVGPFAERDGAAVKLQELRASGYPAFVTSLR